MDGIETSWGKPDPITGCWRQIADDNCFPDLLLGQKSLQDRVCLLAAAHWQTCLTREQDSKTQLA